MEKDIAIEINEVSKVYPIYSKPSMRLWESLSFRKKSFHKDFSALNNVSCKIKKGSCFGIIGTNGSGKSTLLKIITDVLAPTSGEVKVNGKVSALLELGAGFNQEYTGLENIYLNGLVMGYSKEQIEEKIPSILKFADIGEFINQKVKTYSSGMFARLAFSVAINVDPDILIVDEALSVGDIYFQSKCFKKFNEFRLAGKTIIFVTHDLSCVLNYCDTVMLLNKGNVVQIGSAAETIDTYKKILSNTYVEEKTANALDQSKDEKNTANHLDGEWKSHLAQNPTPTIYGDKKVEIIDYAIIDHKGEISNTVTKGEQYEIKVALKFNENVENVISTFTIKTNKGVAIEGTNTLYENVSLNAAKKGDIVTVTYKQFMNIQPGQYLLSISATKYEGQELHILHRCYDICSLDVIGSKTTTGFVDPFTNISIKIN